jgi:hypothetical protein
MRQTEASYELMDVLGENRQFLVRGGAGTGKTWMAFEQARRWAESGGTGNQVLLLCYNVALADFLRTLAETAERRGEISVGRLVVQSWEELARDVIEGSGLDYDLPPQGPQRARFYEKDLPELMMQVVRENLCQPKYDALIVDEGQDHDTAATAPAIDWPGPGWWGIYWKLLKEGTDSRLAVYYDPAQRPVFRRDAFNEQAIYCALGSRPVRLKLVRTVRYTKPIFSFLKELRVKALEGLVDGLGDRGVLIEGPKVQQLKASKLDLPNVVSGVVKKWVDQGFARPEQILILSQHSTARKSGLSGVSAIAGFPLVDYLKRQTGAVSFTSANKAKGLDALAVILIDFPAFQTITEPGLQISFFIGASRARQLLAIVEAV